MAQQAANENIITNMFANKSIPRLISQRVTRVGKTTKYKRISVISTGYK